MKGSPFPLLTVNTTNQFFFYFFLFLFLLLFTHIPIEKTSKFSLREHHGRGTQLYPSGFFSPLSDVFFSSMIRVLKLYRNYQFVHRCGNFVKNDMKNGKTKVGKRFFMVTVRAFLFPYVTFHVGGRGFW